MDFIMVPLIIGIVAVGFYGFVELLAHRRERLNIIEKMGPDLNPDMLRSHFNLPAFRHVSGGGYGAIKIAGLMIGVGLGLLVAFFIYCYAYDFISDAHYLREVLFGASVLLFGGLGLLVAFIVELKMRKDRNRPQ